ncbi:MAG: ABC transporter ATP-binding protein [Hyphomicrobiaceae bacterium]|nr:ABC transporter ATP-binding protein [Hyphomicrobiaceae bacterium]
MDLHSAMTAAQPKAAPARDIVRLSEVVFSWQGTARTVAAASPGDGTFRLQVPSFQVEAGSKLLLTGPSGSGKTTLLNMLCGITIPQRGTVEILGTSLATLSAAARDRFRAEHIGVIFQMFNLLPYGSVLDNVILPLSFAPRRAARAASAGGVVREARRLLAALDLPERLLLAPAAQLSIGQQQRVAAARALIGTPEIVIADEPTSALDRVNQERFLDLLFAQVEASGTTLLMVSHDDGLARRFSRTVQLSELIVAEPTA